MGGGVGWFSLFIQQFSTVHFALCFVLLLLRVFFSFSLSPLFNFSPPFLDFLPAVPIPLSFYDPLLFFLSFVLPVPNLIFYPSSFPSLFIFSLLSLSLLPSHRVFSLSLSSLFTFFLSFSLSLFFSPSQFLPTNDLLLVSVITSPFTIFLSLLLSCIILVLSSPNRAINRSYFQSPRRFLITGAASGMGRHLAISLARRGHDVCGADQNEKALSELHEIEPGITTCKLDVRSEVDWKNALQMCKERWGGIDVAMNVAGCLCPAPIQQQSIPEIDLQLDVNLKGVILGTKLSAEQMQKQGTGGHIINFSSMAALAAVSGVTIYSTSKFGCRGPFFSRSLISFLILTLIQQGFSLCAWKDLLQSSVVVTCFMPDAVATPMVDLQLHTPHGALAFSSDILSLQQVENAVIDEILIERPPEYRLSSRKHVARLGDIIGTSRLILFVESFMKKMGTRKQKEILKSSTSYTSSTPSLVPTSSSVINLSQKALSTISHAFVYLFIFLLIFWGILLCGILLTSSLSPYDQAPRMVPFNSPTALEVADHFSGGNLEDKTFIVTGGTSGIGFETVRSLAFNGAHVIMTGRSTSRGRDAISILLGEWKEISSEKKKSSLSNLSIQFEELDLSSFQSIDSFVQKFKRVRIDGVVCNAGFFSPIFSTSQDGLEQVFQVNHLGHQYLVTQLLPSLQGGRVVIVSSWWSAMNAPDHSTLPHHLQYTEKTYPFFGFQAYGLSKLGNIRFARELSHRFSSSYSLQSFVIHPGLVPTNLGLSRTPNSLFSQIEHFGASLFWKSIWPLTKTTEQGAATQVYCLLANDNTTKRETGLFYDNVQHYPFPPRSDDSFSLRDDIDFWEKSENLITDSIQQNNFQDKGRIQQKMEEMGWFSVFFLSSSTSLLSSINLSETIVFNGAIDLFKLILLHFVFYVVSFTFVFNGLKFGLQSVACGLPKINPTNPPTGLIQQERARTLISSVIDAIYCFFILKYPGNFEDKREDVQGTQSTPLLSIILYSAFILLWTDFHFYWTHRLLHIGPLYRWIHSVHHQSVNPNPWSSLSFHPIESIVFFSAYLIIFMVPLPFSLFVGFKVGMVFGPLMAHLGYDTGIYQSSPHHYLHHRYKKGNFGGWPTGLWDKLCDTELAQGGKPSKNSFWLKRSYVIGILTTSIGFYLSSYFFSNWVLLSFFVFLYVSLIDGWLVIFPPRESEQKRKVFVIGLSRTGTTSLNHALNMLGYNAHHSCLPMCSIKRQGQEKRRGRGKEHRIHDEIYNVQLVSKYSDALDALTDIPVALTYQELAQRYPDSLFILSQRNPQMWGKAMVQFTQCEPNRTLFKMHPVANQLYSALYGSQWDKITSKEFERIYKSHETEVLSYFDQSPDLQKRLLCLSVAQERGKSVKESQSDQLWGTLCDFLEIPRLKRRMKPQFPHKYVFRYSAIEQPLRQITYLFQHLSTFRCLALLIIFSLILFPGIIFDHGQCDRACGAALFSANTPNLAISIPGGYPSNPTIFSDWETCHCPDPLSSLAIVKEDPHLSRSIANHFRRYEEGQVVEESDFKGVQLEKVKRKYLSDNWTFPYETTAVCGGSDQKEYSTTSEAAREGARVLSCGFCGACTNDGAIRVYDQLGEKMTIEASKCAIATLFFGRFVGRMCVTELMGLRESECGDCWECWVANMQCTAASCFNECVLGYGNPLNAPNNPDGGTVLSPCLACDELHCSPAFLRCAGANRRLAGVVTDIKRTNSEVCQVTQRPNETNIGSF